MTLFNFIIDRIEQLKRDGRIRTSETYTAAYKSFRNFRNNCDISIEAFDQTLICDYQQWLTRRKVSANTVSFYMRILRAVYNLAIEKEEIPDRHPFRRVYTGIAKTVKRALSLNEISKIRNTTFEDEKLNFARDVFMMSFYLRGMSFIDMAFLRKSDLKEGYLFYNRRKTGSPLTIEWTSEMEEILRHYPDNSGKYLLPILHDEGRGGPEEYGEERRKYRAAICRINRALKIIALRLGIQGRLTLYVARHSWATAAQTAGIPIGVISEGMGHSSEVVTRIYLANLRQGAVDKANSKILRLLAKKNIK